MLFSSPSNAKQLLSLSLDLRPTTTTIFSFFLLPFLWLTLQTKKWYNNKLQYKNRRCASHKRRRTPDRNNAQERENNALKEERRRKETDRRGRKEGSLELFFGWLSIAKNIFWKNIKSGKLHMLLEIFNSHQ